MLRRVPFAVLLLVAALLVGCSNKKVNNPLANVGSKQPDKVLFDRAMDAMKHNRFDVARMTMQTLINTYPDSEYIARAKLAVADSWYAEGGSTSLAQAEVEYKDFETFFPNMAEAAEAQLKIANIHYQEMEKPDRDFTHALRAEEEYRQLILQWPDSKLVPEAKERLMEVQEVIAEREFRVGRFYFNRQSYPAAIARLRSLSDKYPLYSKADETLYLLGQSYESEVTQIRSRNINEAAKARMIEQFSTSAAQAYSRIVTRYPLMGRVDDAKARLEALHQPVPRPTKAQVAENRAEENSRRESTTLNKVVRVFDKHPDTNEAAKVGDPTLVDPKTTSARDVIQQAANAAMGQTGTQSAKIEAVTGTGAPPPDQPAPRSDTAVETSAAVESAAPASNSPAAAPASGGTTAADPNELTPNVAADPNELKPNVQNDSDSANNGQPLPPPAPVNELASDGSSGGGDVKTAAASSSSSAATDEDLAQGVSSSKHKKKKGLARLNPF
jgi:outer membrane protein assembly factor BamD